jgi:hypothetical protein
VLGLEYKSICFALTSNILGFLEHDVHFEAEFFQVWTLD